MFAVGQDHQAHQAFALPGHPVQVDPQQGLAVLHPGAGLDQQGKTLALQLDRVQAQVHQQFGAVVGAQGQGVPRSGDMNDLAGTRRMQAIVERVDGQPRAHGTAGEYRIVDLGKREHGPAQRCAEGDVVLVMHGAVLVSGYG